MGAKQAVLHAHNTTLQGEVERWKAMWRQTTAANSELSQRLAALQVSQQVSLTSHIQ